MQEFLEQRSFEQVLSDLRASYQRRPGPTLAEMIRKVEAEITYRDPPRNDKERDAFIEPATANQHRECGRQPKAQATSRRSSGN